MYGTTMQLWKRNQCHRKQVHISSQFLSHLEYVMFGTSCELPRKNRIRKEISTFIANIMHDECQQTGKETCSGLLHNFICIDLAAIVCSTIEQLIIDHHRSMGSYNICQKVNL